MRDAIKMMESKISPESIKKVHEQAEREILSIRLAQLREEQNIKQTDIKNFTQSSVSKIERRKDLKISTLIDYLGSIGMGVEIKAYAKNPSLNVKEKLLMRV